MLRICKIIAIGFSMVLSLLMVFIIVLRLAMTEHVSVKVSPKGNFNAEVVRLNGGATTGFAYNVNVTSNDCFSYEKRIAFFESPILYNGEYGLNLDWVDDHTLHIKLFAAKEYHVSTYYENICGDYFHVKTTLINPMSGVPENK